MQAKRKTDSNENQNDYSEDYEEQELSFSCAETVTRTFRFFLDEDISAPNKYRNLINVLLSAQPDDCVQILFNSGGGRLDSAVAIISAIFSSQATVVGIVVGDCYSAASMIALACHELYVDEFGTFMVHSASYGVGGVHRDIAERASFEESRLNKIYNVVYQGFLTEDEIHRVRNGYTYWMQADEVRERLEKREAFFAELDSEDEFEDTEVKALLLS